MAEAVGDLYYQVTLETQKLVSEARKLEERLQRMADKGGQAGDQLQGKMTAVAAAISAALSAIAVEALVTKIISAQRQFDVMYASLKTMTGGADQASAAFEKLTKFAAQTPFTLKQSVDGFVKLKALGLDPSERAMTSFGNTSSAMGKDLMQMIEAVADASTGEFERLKEFGIKAKQEGDKVSLTFQGVTTTIGNNAREITEYLVKIGETNFAGAMSERMNTLDGNISNLQDSLDGLFRSIAQSGFGEAVAAGVRAASEVISELTASIKQGELTDYFAALKPVITAAEVAVVSLAGAVTARLIVAFVASATQAYATATAIGAATVAARGFTAVLAALGGPIGIAITGLALLALNWEKVAGEARDAATMSEEAGDRIAKALAKGGAAAGKALSGQMAEVRREIADIDKELANTKFPLASPEDLNELRKRKETLLKTAAEIAAAMDGTRAKPEAADPPAPTPATPKPKKPKGEKFDSEAYLASLRKAQASEINVVNETEAEKLRLNKKLLDEKKIDETEYAEGIRLIALTAEEDRVAIMAKAQEKIDKLREDDARDAKTALDKRNQDIKAAADYALNLTRAIDPIAALTAEYQAKLELVTQYEAMMQAAKTDATAQGELARNQITAQYELQRTALAEQTFRSQGEAQAALIDSLNSLSSTATSSIMGLIQGTMTAQEALRGLANTVLNEAVGALVQMGVQYVKNALLEKTVAASKGAAYAASVGAQVAGMSALAAQNAFAATAAIPVVGPGLAPAAAAAAAAAAGALGSPAVMTAPLAGARQYGGPVSAGGMYRVNEAGAPEMFTGSNGQQYMLPTKSGQVTAADQVGGGVQWNIIVNNTAAGTQATASVDQAERTVKIAVATIASQFRSNEGEAWSALRGASNVRGAL